MDTVSQQTRDYELMAILIPDLAEEDTQAQIDRVNGFITDVDGQVTETLVDSPWGRRRLAYTIRHEGVDYRDGFYTVIHFTAAPGRIADIERELKLDTSVIRYLLVMDDPKAGEKVDPQALAAAEEQAEETAPTGEPTQAPAEQPEVADEPAQEAAEETPVEAPASGTEAAVVETAEAIEGEEEPAPANGGAASEKEA